MGPVCHENLLDLFPISMVETLIHSSTTGVGHISTNYCRRNYSVRRFPPLKRGLTDRTVILLVMLPLAAVISWTEYVIASVPWLDLMFGSISTLVARSHSVSEQGLMHGHYGVDWSRL